MLTFFFQPRYRKASNARSHFLDPARIPVPPDPDRRVGSYRPGGSRVRPGKHVPHLRRRNGHPDVLAAHWFQRSVRQPLDRTCYGYPSVAKKETTLRLSFFTR